jgi:hypothetical protein
MSDRIIDRITKLFALSNSNFEEEAKAALQKAHLLMLKYNLSMHDISAREHEIPIMSQTECKINTLVSKLLAQVVADKFRCRLLARIPSGKSGKNMYATFCGFKEDAQVAATVFKYALEYLTRLRNLEAQKMYDKGFSTKGFSYSFGRGFAIGLSNEWQEQCTSEYSLVCTVPLAVATFASKLALKKCGVVSQDLDLESFNLGEEKGREFGSNKNALEEEIKNDS